MTATMGRKKPKDYHKEPRESFHLPANLRAALLEYIDATRPRPAKSEVLRLALEEFLAKQGHWPPKKP